MQKIYRTITALFIAGAVFASCSKEYMEGMNTDTSKVEAIDPNMQLTTALLQTYGDFSLMDTYRSYITGFTQHYAGGWNVTNYAGSVFAQDDQMRLLWDRMYTSRILLTPLQIQQTSRTSMRPSEFIMCILYRF